jgi:selenocysteine lyase/cysteine desulfurase
VDHAARFVACEGIYLLSHSVGRPPLGARGRVADEFFAPWERGQGDPWPQWLAAIEAFRDALGALFNSAAANFCPQTNLSSALAKILWALPLAAERRTLLLSEDDFPSMGFVIAQAERRGYRVRFMARECSVLDVGNWDRHLEGDVALALLTHVQSNTSRMMPVAEVAALARARGIVSVVDIAQSGGVIPIDLQSWNADFVIGSCVKWLCGGPGAAYLWVNPDIVARCEPLDVGWFSHANPFEFAIRDFRYHPGALRFWGGTPSVLPFVLASAGIGLVTEIGIDNVRAHNLRLCQRLVDAVDGSALRSPVACSERGGTVVLDPGARLATFSERLDRCLVRFDVRASGLRLSPHIYNTDQEIDAVLDCLRG